MLERRRRRPRDRGQLAAVQQLVAGAIGRSRGADDNDHNGDRVVFGLDDAERSWHHDELPGG